MLINRPGLAVVALAATLIAGCASPEPARWSQTAPGPATATSGAAPVWGYRGADGPGHWGELASDFQTCKTGARQSPIDLPASAAAGQDAAITAPRSPSVGTVVDTGHTIQFNDTQKDETIVFDNDTYRLVQMHFHTPSEHTVGGQPAAVEFHLVHADSTGRLLVLAVMAREGVPASEALEPFVTAAAKQEKGQSVGGIALDLQKAIPARSDYWSYDGSLTTPPCTEGVQWLVLKTVITLSHDQVATLQAAHAENARPTQQRNGRTVSSGHEALDATVGG